MNARASKAPPPKEAADQLKAAQRLEIVLESMHDGLLAVDQHWRIDLINSCAAGILGRPREDLLHSDFRIGMDIAVIEAVRQVMERRQPLSFEHFSSGSGRWLDYRLSASPDGGVVVFFADVTERKQAAERALLVAQHDALTGLANRKLLREEAERILAAARRQGHKIAILFLDLDRFKPINDAHGHEVGDKLLKAVAKRIGRKLRAEDAVGRIGGDEFVAVLVGIKDVEDAGRVAASIVDTLGRPYRINGFSLDVGASIGISLFPDHGDTIDMLFKRADAAMYAAKRTGRSRFAFYAHGVEGGAATTAGITVAERLRTALAAGEFSLHFQPVFSSLTADVVEVEALMRWRQADGTSIAPRDFLPVAEVTGVIKPLGEWLLREACSQQRRWVAEGLGEITIGVTLSGVQFRQKDFAQQLVAIIAETGIEPQRLLLNIAESTIVGNVDESIHLLRELHAAGVGVAIKNFGLAESNVRALARLPVDKIRVDRSFLRHNGGADSRGNGNGHAAADAIISLGHSLHREVIAEGVENEADMEYLRTRGVEYCQGYLLAAPMPADEFADWWSRRKSGANPPPPEHRAAVAAAATPTSGG